MKFRKFVAGVVAAPFLMAAAPQPVRLQPSSQWIVDYAENSCRLIRTFGQEDQKTVLLFESAGPGELSVLAVGKPLSSSLTEVPAKFVPVQNRPMLGGPAKSSKSNQPAVLWSSVSLLPETIKIRLGKSAAERKTNPGLRPPPVDLNERAAERTARQSFAAGATELEIDTRARRPVILETGSLGDAIKMFDQCNRDSLRDWGVDPDLEDKIVRPAWPLDQSRWLSGDDYPRAAVFRGAESEVSARLLIDAAGKVTSCTSLSHFDSPEFQKVVCEKLSKRGRFAPAELADGTKVPSYYTIHIVFRIAG